MAAVEKATEKVIYDIEKLDPNLKIPVPPEKYSKLNLETWLNVLQQYYAFLKKELARGGSEVNFSQYAKNGVLKNAEKEFKQILKNKFNKKVEFVDIIKQVSRPENMNKSRYNSMVAGKLNVRIYRNENYEKNMAAYLSGSGIRPKVIIIANQVPSNVGFKLYNNITIPGSINNVSSSSSGIRTYRSGSKIDVQTVIDKLSLTELPTRDNNRVKQNNIFFTGPSGSGKTTFVDKYVEKLGQYDLTCFAPEIKFRDSGFAGSAMKGERVVFGYENAVKLKSVGEFKARFVRPTPYNKESSRTHLIYNANGIYVYDLAGKENPIDMSKRALGFNIFDKKLQPPDMKGDKKISGGDYTKFKKQLKVNTDFERFVCSFLWNIFYNRLTFESGVPKYQTIVRYFKSQLYEDVSKLDITRYAKGYSEQKLEIYNKYVKGLKHVRTPNDMIGIQEKTDATNTAEKDKPAVTLAQFLFDTVSRCIEGYYINMTLHEIRHVFVPDIFPNFNKYMKFTKNIYTSSGRYIKRFNNDKNNFFSIDLEDLTPNSDENIKNFIMFYPTTKQERLSRFTEFIVNRGKDNGYILVGVINGGFTKNKNIQLSKNAYKNFATYLSPKVTIEEYFRNRAGPARSKINQEGGKGAIEKLVNPKRRGR